MEIIEYVEAVKEKSNFLNVEYAQKLKYLINQHKEKNFVVYLQIEFLLSQLKISNRNRKKSNILRKLIKLNEKVSEKDYKQYVELYVNFYKQNFDFVIENFSVVYSKFKSYDSFLDELLKIKFFTEKNTETKIETENKNLSWKNISLEFKSEEILKKFEENKKIIGNSFNTKLANKIILFKRLESKLKKSNNLINTINELIKTGENLKSFMEENFVEFGEFEENLNEYKNLKISIEKKSLNLPEKFAFIKNLNDTQKQNPKKEIVKFLRKLVSKDDLLTDQEQKPPSPVFYDLAFDFIEEQ